MNRIDGLAKVTGRAVYVGDITLEKDHAIVVPVLAPFAPARIADIDARAALNASGVMSVITHENAPRLFKASALSGSELSELLPLQNEKILYPGQCVALVVARDLTTARNAAGKLRITYEDGQRKPITKLDQAGDKLEPVTRAVTVAGKIKRGNINSALDMASVRVEGIWRTSPQHHNPMELGATIAHWTEEGDLVIHAPVQWAPMAELTLGQVFGFNIADRMPGFIGRVTGLVRTPGRVRIIPTLAGGSFGRNNSELFLVLAAMAAKVAGKRVRLELSRKDSFFLMPYRGETRQHVTLGADMNGRLTAVRVGADIAKGAAGGFVEPVGEATPHIYACDNMEIVHSAAALDLNATGWMRAPGIAVGQFALEGAMNELADQLGIDPLEIRRRNHADRDPQSGKEWTSKSLLACYDEGAKAIGWNSRHANKALFSGNRLISYGMATAYHPNRQFPASAILSLDRNGRVSVRTKVAEIGQGSITALAMVVAEAFGTPPEQVDVVWNDPDLPPGAPTFGSAGTLSNAEAVVKAAKKVRSKLFSQLRRRRTSPHYGARNFSLSEGKVCSTGGVQHLAEAMRDINNDIAARATTGLTMGWSRQVSAAFGAQFARVSIDRDTAEVHVDHLVGAFSCGRVVNRPVLRGQLAGAMIWGIGQALMEETIPDPDKGAWINANLAEALVPVNADVERLDVLLVDEDDHRFSETGIKGAGEIGLVGVAAAIAAAIHDATGIRARSLPIRIDQLIHETSLAR